MARGRLTRGAAALVLAALASCSPGPPSVVLRSGGRPNAFGWHRRPTRVVASASAPAGLADVCFWVVPNFPTGTSVSAVRLPCEQPRDTGRWSQSRLLAEEARYIVQLSATDEKGRRVAAPDLDLRVDLTAPVAVIDAPAGAFTGGVVLTGRAEDASSGVRSVELELTRTGERLTLDASCACARDTPAPHVPEPWRFEGDVPAGRWTVRAIARDYAGWTSAPGQAAEIEVR